MEPVVCGVVSEPQPASVECGDVEVEGLGRGRGGGWGAYGTGNGGFNSGEFTMMCCTLEGPSHCK